MSSSIRVFNESSIPRAPKIKVKSAIEKIFSDENINNYNLNVIYVNDDAILELNKKYLNHNRTTDVISFPLSDDDDYLEGEIYISAETAKKQAVEYQVSTTNEELRLAIHGALHLAGYKDKTSEEFNEMKLKEEFYLRQIYQK